MEKLDFYLDEESEQSPYRVMVVDDNDIELKLYANGLSKHFTLSFAKSSGEAWDLLNRAPIPDVIILDILMPNEDGLALCDRVKSSEFTHDIPIIFISALTGPTIKAQAFSLGGADFVSKPPMVDELVARINRHVKVYRKTKRLQSLIYIDPLTHLPNESKFRNVLSQEWARCARYWHHLSLVLVRIENITSLKNSNRDDYYNLIASIADDLSSVGERPGDLFAHLSEELFGLILSDCSLKGANHKAAQILARFHQPSFVNADISHARRVNCSISVASAAPAGGGQPEGLFSAADELLFEAKQYNTSKVYSADEVLGVDNLIDHH